MKDIKIFLSDLDGVWTDGGMYYDNEGNELKRFNTSDSAGVLFLRMLGIPVGIITGEDTEIVARRAGKLGITILHMGVRDKLAVVRKICGELGCGLDEVAYLGDDIIDIPVLEKAGLSAAPSNAPAYVKDKVRWVLEKKGGEGVFREFVEKYLAEKGLLEKAINLYLSGIK
jgi:3-deoxy-D-manno-octulosonate 8-phosphate phosphatase (KDO 8-P phosphatase)